MILMMNYFQGLPESLMESARLDGAGEWKILFSVVLPLAAPIIATITLFYGVAYWNSWYDAMIFLRKADQLPRRTCSGPSSWNRRPMHPIASVDSVGKANFSTGMKMAAVFVTMVPIMCFFPVLQNILPKGINRAIKT